MVRAQTAVLTLRCKNAAVRTSLKASASIKVLEAVYPGSEERYCREVTVTANRRAASKEIMTSKEQGDQKNRCMGRNIRDVCNGQMNVSFSKKRVKKLRKAEAGIRRQIILCPPDARDR